MSEIAAYINHVTQSRIASRKTPTSKATQEQAVGAKTWMLVYANGKVEEALKRAPLRLATRMFPKDKLELIGDGDLSYTCPPDDELHIACFPGVSILAAKEFGIDYPSRLQDQFISEGAHGLHPATEDDSYPCPSTRLRWEK